MVMTDIIAPEVKSHVIVSDTRTVTHSKHINDAESILSHSV